MRKIRIAHIGCNLHSHAKQIFGALAAQPELFEIVGYTLPEDERETAGKRVAAFAGYREMTLEEILNDPTIEAVTVETEELRLTKYAQLAIDHGKHVHMEKPGGIELAAFEKLIESVKQSGKVLHIGYMYRYNPVIIKMMERIKAGEIGEVFSVEAHMSCRHKPETREFLARYPGGMMFYLGCHLVDLILQIQGKPEGIIPLNCRTGFDGVTAEDYGMAVLQYKNGVSFAKTCGEEMGGYARRQVVVTGSKGTFEIRPFEQGTEASMITGLRTYKEAAWGDGGFYEECAPFDRYNAMMASFAAMVRGEKQNPCTPDYELELYKTVLRCCGVKF